MSPVRLGTFAAVAIAGSVAGFVVLEVAAMRLYPGGTWWNTSAAGHRFWQNYLCDLTQPVAVDGVANPVGSVLARAAMLVLVAGLLPFWAAVPRLFARPRLARPVRALGFVSMAAVVWVVLLPGDRFGRLHGALVVLAGAPGLSAALLAVAGLRAGQPRARFAGRVGAAMLSCATIDFAAYVGHLAAGGLGTPLLPALQKIALCLLIVWMLSVCLALGVDPRRTGANVRSAPAQARPR